MDCREILVVGLNPAFQTTLHFKEFEPGKVNRAYRKAHSIGGKGQNFAIACEQYGEADKITLLQFIGGRTGEYVQDYLCEKGIHQVTVSVEKPTRQCTTLLDGKTGDMTELIEPPGRISLEEKEVLEKISHQLILSPRLEGIALCGSLPGGITGSTFSSIIEDKSPSTIVFLDACKDIDVLKSGLVHILKVNSEEAIHISGLCSETHLVEVGIEILRKYSVNIVAITSGPNTAVLLDNSSKQSLTVSEFTLPNLLDIIKEESLDVIRDDSSSYSKSLPEAVGIPCFSSGTSEKISNLHPDNARATRPLLNPLGAGDTCSGIFLLEFLDTRDAITSFRYGLAAASASCLLIDSFDPEEFVACARYGELDEMIELICRSEQVSDLAQVQQDKLMSIIKTKNSHSQSALHLSAANGHLQIVEFLTKYLSPKDINSTTNEGSSSLHWAALNGHLAVVEKLLEAGADARLLNASGRSPVTLAEQQSHLEVVQVLLKSYDPEDDESIENLDESIENLDESIENLDESIENLDENGNVVCS